MYQITSLPVSYNCFRLPEFLKNRKLEAKLLAATLKGRKWVAEEKTAKFFTAIGSSNNSERLEFITAI